MLFRYMKINYIKYTPFIFCFEFSNDAECLRLSLLVLALTGIWLRTILDAIGALLGIGNFDIVGTFDGLESRGALAI